MRCNELTYLNVNDVSVRTNVNGELYLEVNIKQSKTDQEGRGFKFHVKPLDTDYCPLKLYLVYNPLVKSGRLWRTYNKKSKKFTTRPFGINKILDLPKRISSFLGLKGNYSGHSIRRTSSTVFAEQPNATIL